MSTTIDTNVVELKFDNKQFEENCKESMSTLEKLKQKIDDSSSGKALDGLNKTDLSGLEKSLDKINSHFSLLGIAALKVKNSIVDGFLGMAKTLATTVPNIIKQGGWDRAMNIERAKFQLEGLHVAWQDIKGDIEYAVDGTAYGLDAAASAASQLVASGIQVGDSMKNALRAISGVAAMTNSEYEAISPIFTTVAGQGKLMTMQLRQLESRGLNAAAVLAESMGTTEAAVRDMVTKGQIDFNTFAEAMDSAFGEHAKDANRTFEGVTANIRAALKKIGADFSTPIIEQDGPVIQALQKLRERINDVRKSLGPLTQAWTNFVKHYGTVAANMLDNLDMSFMEHIVAGLVNVFKALLTILRPIGYAFKDVFASDAASNVMAISEAFESFTSKLILSDKAMEGLRATVRGILSIFSIFTTVIKQVLGALIGIKPESVDLIEIILTITGTIGNVITYLAMLIKQMNIVGPIITVLGTAIKIVAAVLITAVSGLIKFVSYVSKLEITRKIISGLEVAVKALAAGIMLLVSAVVKLVTGGFKALPEILKGIADGFGQIIDWLSQVPIINSAIDAIKRLGEAISNLLNPKIKEGNNLEKTVTIVDDAVALAGPPQVKQLSFLEKAIIAVGNALTFVKNGLIAVFTPIKNFIEFLGVGGIAALAFVVAIGAIGVKLTKTLDAVSKSVNATAGVLKTLGSDGVMGLIFGKKQQAKPNRFLEFAAAIGVLAASLKLISTVPTDKLKEVGIVMAGMAGGILVLITALTIAQKVLGKGEELVVAGTLISIAASIGVMTASLMALNKLVTDNKANLQGAGAALTQLSLVLSVMGIALAKLAPQLSTGALSLVAMAVSIRILIGALNKLSDISVQLDRNAADYNGIWGKTGYLMVVAGGLVIISGIASKLGTNSLIGILVALLSLKAIVPLANSVAESIQNSIFADAWNKLVEFWSGMPETLKKIGPYVLAAISAVALIFVAVKAFKKLKQALVDIGSISAGAEKEVGKLEGLQKALARLSLVPVIIALTGMMIAIGAMVAIIGNIKIANLNQALVIMGVVAGMFGMLALVVAASKDSKPASVIAAMIGLTVMFSELVVLSFLIEQHYVGVIGACIVMATIMHELANVFESLAEASEIGTKTLIAVGIIGGIIGELGTIIYLLSGQNWASVLVSGAAMSAAMLSFSKMLTEIGETGQSFTKNKFIAMAECAAVVATIGIVLADIAKNDWASILASGAAMSGAMLAFGKMVQALGEDTVKFDISKFALIAECAGVTVAIGGALALATMSHDWASILVAGVAMSATMLAFAKMTSSLGDLDMQSATAALVALVGIAVAAVAVGAALALATLSHDWTAILAAAGGMSLVIVAFGAITKMLGQMNPQQALTSFVALMAISVAAVAIGASLAMLAQYPWQDILAAAGIMAGTLAVLGVVAGLLGVFSAVVIPGAIALDLLAAAMLGISIAVTTFLSALTAFLPVADQFISGVIGTLVSYSAQLPSAATGLLGLAGGLAAVGAAGLVLTLGAIGLLATSAALPGIAEGMVTLASADYESLNNASLVKIAGGLVAIAAAGVLLIAGAPGLIVGAAGLSALGPACEDLKDVDLIPLAKGLAELVVPGLAMALVGPAMVIGAAGMALLAAAMIALGAALKTISSVIGPASKAIDELGKKVQAAKNWGADLVNNFVNGIKQKFTDLKNAVTGITDIIYSYLHFTTPDVGKLVNADTWTPDMMDLLNSGILDGIPDIEASMNQLTESMDVEDTMKQLGMDNMEGFMDGFESMNNMDWFNSLGYNAGASYVNGMSDALSKARASVGVKALDKSLKDIDWSKGTLGGLMAVTDAGKAAKEASDDFAYPMEYELAPYLTSTIPLLDDFSKSVGGAGGAASKAADKVSKLGDAFKTVEKGAKVDLGNMINTLAENAQETARWAQDMKMLMGKGFDSAITDWIRQMGVGGHETVKAFMNASEQEVTALNTALKSYLTLDENAEKYILGEYDELGGLIVQVLDESVQTYSTKLAETIQSAIDPFGEFDKKTEMTGDQMLSNMRSQITGISEWSNNVTSLIGRVPDSLIQYFQELGPASYEEVNAMAHMTEGQLAEAVELWNQQLELGKQLAIQQAQKYREVGMAVTEGITNGIDFNQATEDGVQLGQNLVTGATSKEGLDINSPSKKFLKVGGSVVEGLVKGIQAQQHVPVNCMIILSTNMITETMKILNWSKGRDISGDLLSGLQYGIEHDGGGVVDAMKSLCNSIIDAAEAIFDEHSPSRVFKRIGLYLDEGLANGIDNGTDMAVSATQRMGDSTVQMMNDIIKSISDSVSDSPEFQPTIRPRLDLTALQNGKSQIGGMFDNPAYGLAYGIASGYPGVRSASTTQVITNNTDVVSAINSLRGDVNELTNQMSSMQVMLDGQTLVGELTPAIDSALGTNAMRAGRGN